MKPGPSAESTADPRKPRLSARSSTNSTLGADMLPWPRNTSRSSRSVPFCNIERGLDRVEHLGAAGMADELRRVDAAHPARSGARAPPAAVRRKRGSERDSTTPKPAGSMVQPMMSSVPGQVCSAVAPMRSWRRRRARRAARWRRRRRRTAPTKSRRPWCCDRCERPACTARPRRRGRPRPARRAQAGRRSTSPRRRRRNRGRRPALAGPTAEIPFPRRRELPGSASRCRWMRR